MPLQDPLQNESSNFQKLFGKLNLSESMRKYLYTWIAAGLGFVALVTGIIVWLISTS